MSSKQWASVIETILGDMDYTESEADVAKTLGAILLTIHARLLGQKRPKVCAVHADDAERSRMGDINA